MLYLSRQKLVGCKLNVHGDCIYNSITLKETKRHTSYTTWWLAWEHRVHVQFKSNRLIEARTSPRRTMGKQYLTTGSLKWDLQLSSHKYVSSYHCYHVLFSLLQHTRTPNPARETWETHDPIYQLWVMTTEGINTKYTISLAHFKLTELWIVALIHYATSYM